MEEKKVNIREMTMEDFEEVHALWMGIHGFGIRSIDDSKEGVERFIRRNPTTSMWRVKTTESSVQPCAVMTADADVYIMSAFMRITESRASDRRWWKRALRL